MRIPVRFNWRKVTYNGHQIKVLPFQSKTKNKIGISCFSYDLHLPPMQIHGRHTRYTYSSSRRWAGSFFLKIELIHHPAEDFWFILFFFFIVGRHQESLHRKQAVTKGQRRENRCCIDRRDWFTRSGSAWSEKKKNKFVRVGRAYLEILYTETGI